MYNPSPSRKRRRPSTSDGADNYSQTPRGANSRSHSTATLRGSHSLNQAEKLDFTPEAMPIDTKRGRLSASSVFLNTSIESSLNASRRSRYRELIDLTESPPTLPAGTSIPKMMPSSVIQQSFEAEADLRLAKALQAELDAEGQNTPYSDRHPQGSILRGTPSQIIDLTAADDERSQVYARGLQVQLDSEIRPAAVEPMAKSLLSDEDKAEQSDNTKTNTEDLQLIQKYGEEISKLTCLTCGAGIVIRTLDLKSIAGRWLEAGDPCPYDIECQNCSDMICGGCGHKVQVKGKGKSNVNTQNKDACCDRGRLFAIWLISCYNDQRKPPALKQSGHMTEHSRKRHPRSPNIIPLFGELNPFAGVDELFPKSSKEKAPCSRSPITFSQHGKQETPALPAPPAPPAFLPQSSKQKTTNPPPPTIPLQFSKQMITMLAPSSFPPHHSKQPAATLGHPQPRFSQQLKGSPGIKSMMPSFVKKPNYHLGESDNIRKWMEKRKELGFPDAVEVSSDDDWSDYEDSIDEPSPIKLPKGTGYGRDRRPSGFWQMLGRPGSYDCNQNLQDDAFAREQKVADIETQRLLKLLSSLLPDLSRNAVFDISPPSYLRPILAQSQILHKVAELLRNDSLSDATNRSGLYHQVFDFTQRLALHYVTSPLVFAKRDCHVDKTDLHQIAFKKAMPRIEKVPSIVDCAQNLITQSKAILRAFGARQEELGDADAEEMLALCTHAADLSEHITIIAQTSDETIRLPIQAEPWKQWQEQNGVIDINDEEIFRQHHFKSKASSLHFGRPGRIRRLLEETVALRTALPPGIFLRHGTSRLDVMKVLIIGPEDTPYEGGIFEFDVFCPADYPCSPPEFIFMTTGGGKAHFNPNLYPCGKVCLSLLNTWAGERWNASKSTMLQVLVSLQSMIFCENPWYNEPGRETGGFGHQASQKYNQQIQLLTVKHALLDWLHDRKSSIWNDVVGNHFRYNGQKILERVKSWEKTNKSLPSPIIKQLSEAIHRTV